MSKNGKNLDKIIEDGVGIEKIQTTTVEIAPGQAALIVDTEGITMATPNDEDGKALVTRAVLFVIGVYLEASKEEFVEKMVRAGINGLQEGANSLRKDNPA